MIHQWGCGSAEKIQECRRLVVLANIRVKFRDALEQVFIVDLVYVLRDKRNGEVIAFAVY